MLPYGFADGVLSFASYDALVASGYRGLATVDGVVYAWSDSLGRMVDACGNLPAHYDTYAELLAAEPVGQFIGQTRRITQIIGNGTYEVFWSGTRWKIFAGSAPIYLSTELPHTAVSTSYAEITSGIIGPLIGDNETWEFAASIRSGGVWTTGGSVQTRLTGSTANIGSSATLAGTSYRGRKGGTFKRKGGKILCVSGAGDYYSVSSVGNDLTVASWDNLALAAGIVPGATGDTYVLEEFICRRV